MEGTSDVVGRGPERAAIAHFIEQVGDGPAALVMDGVAGIGKTTLWASAVDLARGAGYQVLVARPSSAESTLPLGGFGDMFSSVDDRVLATLPAPQRLALEVALLRADPAGAALDQRAIAFAATKLVHALSQTSPVLIAVDDSQWLDPTSAAIVSFAARRLDPHPVGILAARRIAVFEPGPFGLDVAMPDHRCQRLTVGPLALAELHRLLVERLGTSLPRVALLRIQQISAGNPFYALEIARTLIASDAAVLTGEHLPVPESLVDLVRARLDRLPARTRDVLLLAAAATTSTEGVLSEAHGGPVRRALQPAMRAGVLATAEGDIRFDHPLLASAVLEMAGGARVRDAHRRLAGVAASPEDRARHLGLAAGGPDEATAVALEAAAVAARARGASLDAAVLFERASALTPDAHMDAAVRRGILAAEDAFIDLADYHYADTILERIVQRAEPGAARADAMSLQGIVRYFHGRQAEATALCEAALNEVGANRVTRAKVLLRTAYLHGQVDMERGRQEVCQAADLLDGEQAGVDADLLALALLERANATLQMAEGLLADDIERGTRLITPDGRSWERDRAEVSAHELARHTDDLVRTIAVLEARVRVRADRGAEDPFLYVHLALINCWTGRWDEARSWAERAVESYNREGEDLYPAFALRGVALVAACQGRTDEARAMASRGLQLAQERGDLVVSILHLEVLGFLGISLGDLGEADRHLRDAEQLAARVGVAHPLRFRLDGDLAEVALGVGDLARAERAVERLERAGRTAPTPWTLAVGARCRGLIDAAAGDLDGAMQALERALAAHDRLPMPLERARTILVKGQLHRRRKEKRAADSTLRAGLAIFDDLGAPLWAAKARAELGRVGLRPRAPDDLTAIEQRVALLAAEGLTNREVAAATFLAPKTVGNVLGRVYQKLGVRSRAELGAWASGGQPPSHR